MSDKAYSGVDGVTTIPTGRFPHAAGMLVIEVHMLEGEPYTTIKFAPSATITSRMELDWGFYRGVLNGAGTAFEPGPDSVPVEGQEL